VSRVSDFQSLLGQSVKIRRRQLGFSQEELAWRAGLHRTYVTDIERGARNLSLATAERLAQALEVPISILLRDVDEARGAIQTNPPNERAQVDILLVEDNPRDAELTVVALRRARLANQIRIAHHGAEALDILFGTVNYAGEQVETRPRLVLLDLKIPLVDGLEVLRRIKSDRRTREIPVVVLTVSESRDDVAEARRLGAEAYIVKPVNFHRLCGATSKLDLSWSLLQLSSQQTK
jgi:CheY-like chemotaxis protein/DNA-binding XRE family transcriptional regulator